MSDMVRRHRSTLSILLFATISYLCLSHLTSLPLPSPISLLRTSHGRGGRGRGICESANFQWRGANDRIYPRSGQAIEVTHNDYADPSAVRHDVSVLVARAQNEEFSIQVDIFTNREVPADNFEITFNREALIINTLVPKSAAGGSGTTNNRDDDKDQGDAGGTRGKEQRQDKQGQPDLCVVIKVHILLPVSRPLSGLSLDFPRADVFVHASTWSSTPVFDITLGTGRVLLEPGQRLHVERSRVAVDEGRVEGSVLVTRELVLFLRQGDVDLDVGFSPFPVGAAVQVTQQGGSCRLRVAESMYRSLHANVVLQRGHLELGLPKSYAGSVRLDAPEGEAKITGDGVQVVGEAHGGKEGGGGGGAWIEARQGNGGAVTKAYVGTGNVQVTVDTPNDITRQVPTVEVV